MKGKRNTREPLTLKNRSLQLVKTKRFVGANETLFALNNAVKAAAPQTKQILQFNKLQWLLLKLTKLPTKPPHVTSKVPPFLVDATGASFIRF